MAKKVSANGKTFTFDDNVTNEQIGTAIDEYFSSLKKKEVTQPVSQTGSQPLLPGSKPFQAQVDTKTPSVLTEKGKVGYEQEMAKPRPKEKPILDFSAIKKMPNPRDAYYQDPTIAAREEKSRLKKLREEYEAGKLDRNTFVKDLDLVAASGIDMLGRIASTVPSAILDNAIQSFGNQLGGLSSMGVDAEVLGKLAEKKLGLPEEYNPLSPNNYLAETFRKRAELNQSLSRKGYNGGITDALKLGEYKDAAKLLTLGFTESLPILLGIAATRGAGMSSTGSLISIGLGTQATTYQDLKQENPEIAKNILFLNATLTGLGEAGSEVTGTNLLYSQARKLFIKGQKEEAKKIVTKGIKEYLDYAFQKSFIGSAVLGDVSGEVSNQIWKNATDKWSGVRPDVDYLDGVGDAALISAFTTSTLAAGAKSLAAIVNPKTKDSVDEVSTKIQNLQKEADNPNMPESARVAIVNEIGNLTEKINEDLKKDNLQYNNLDDDQKMAVDDLSDKRDEIKSAINDTSISNDTKQILQKQLSDIDSQIESILPTEPTTAQPTTEPIAESLKDVESTNQALLKVDMSKISKIKEIPQTIETSELEKIPRGETFQERLAPEYFDKLKQDIKKNGINEPIILKYYVKDNAIRLSEGHHRLKIAKELGIKDIPVKINVVWNSSITEGNEDIKDKPIVNPPVQIDKEKYIKRNYNPSNVNVEELGYKNKFISESYHADKAAGKETELTKAVEELLKPKEDAIQVETTGKIPVQPETTVSEEVEQGKPEAEPESVTEESQQEEIGKDIVGNIKPSWETNIESLVNPKTGLSAVTKKILEEQQPLKDKFLKKQGLTIEDYRKLNQKEKDNIQSKWAKSEEFKQLESRAESQPKPEIVTEEGKEEVVKPTLNKNIKVKDSSNRKGLVPVSELEEFIGEDRLGAAQIPTSRATIDRLKEDIAKNGFKEPIIVFYDKFSGKGEATIIEGNHRIIAAKELGIKEIPVVFEKGTIRTNESRIKNKMFPIKRKTIGIIDDSRGVSGTDLGLTVRQPIDSDFVKEPEIVTEEGKEEVKIEPTSLPKLEETNLDDAIELLDDIEQNKKKAKRASKQKKIELENKIAEAEKELGSMPNETKVVKAINDNFDKIKKDLKDQGLLKVNC